ncbi:nitronate monooxygenase [Sphaerisporangium aureirubrum]|uniref:Nitronate monooxygenase n=1 Tax=Sphaerisporangium aureirubrum TaxID=1544736 RepID=A0ABW1NPS8_9ACTN
MALSTAFTKLLGVRHPIALAPMGGSAGGALAAAVSRGGGLGLVGGGAGDPDWLARELPIAAGAGEPWGVGFLTWAIGDEAVERALEHGPRAVMLSFGDPGPFAARVRRAGAALIVQVTDLEEARRAVDVGADVIVAQGSESGGHGARRGRSTLPFVPVVADLAAPVPVPAAGGIADRPRRGHRPGPRRRAGSRSPGPDRVRFSSWTVRGVPAGRGGCPGHRRVLAHG